jgi:TetR/AcrR family transcriptional regulator, ethionamide resistance regulator
MTRRPDVRARQSVRRKGTQARILDVSLALLEQQRWHDITLEQVMAEAGLTRTAFYRHFPSRHALLVALLEYVGIRIEDLPTAWQDGTGEPLAELRQAVEALTTLYAQVGRLLAAVAEAAAENEQIHSLYSGLADRLIAAVAKRIAADVQAGRSEVKDPLEVARALIWMNEAYLLSQFGREQSGDVTRASAALSDVWIATVYGRRP